MSNYKMETKCVQSGYNPGNGEPRVLPIVQSTTFRYTSSDQMGRLFDLEESGYFYTRLQNPTNDAVAAKICDMEGGVAAMLTSSGQAANFYAIMNIAEEGDHIVCASALYGGTYNLFAHTIRKMGVKATFVDPDCTEEELNAAFQENTKAVFGETIANPALTVFDFEKFAKAAHAHHFIETLPGGYDFVLNEEATNVSQGQRQLLTIARSILADNPILILDEATSSVDTRTEQRIQKAMNHLMQGRTSFVIAHRLSTIKDADVILVMKDGDIIEQGNHEALITQNGFYAELYNSQFENVG